MRVRVALTMESPHVAPADQTAAEQDQSKEFSLAAPIAADDRTFIAKHIFSEQVRLLYRFSLAGYLAELVVTFLLGALLWNELGQRPELFAWFFTAFILMITRYGVYNFFVRANPPLAAMAKWQTAFVVGSLLLAMLWGLMGSVLLPKAGTTQLPVMMLVALLTTGAMTYYAPHRTLYFYYALISLLPWA